VKFISHSSCQPGSSVANQSGSIEWLLRMSIDEGRRRLVPALLATAARIEADLRVAQAARPQRSSGG